MNFIITLLFFSSLSFASMDFAVEKSDPDGLFKLELKETEKNIDVVKTSNWFDRKKDLRLGHFSGEEKELKKILQKISAIESKVKKADEILKQHGSSVNELNDVPVHNTYFVINGIRVLPASP